MTTLAALTEGYLLENVSSSKVSVTSAAKSPTKMERSDPLFARFSPMLNVAQFKRKCCSVLGITMQPYDCRTFSAAACERNSTKPYPSEKPVCLFRMTFNERSSCGDNPRPSNGGGRPPRSFCSHRWILHRAAAAAAAEPPPPASAKWGGGGRRGTACNEATNGLKSAGVAHAGAVAGIGAGDKAIRAAVGVIIRRSNFMIIVMVKRVAAMNIVGQKVWSFVQWPFMADMNPKGEEKCEKDATSEHH
nr:hypothetical protein Iba_chr15aCG3820 [Ipomoea batatas]